MAPVAKQAPSSSSGTSVAQQAGDMLWKFQLRKEHDQLLAKLDAHQEHLSALAADAKETYEKLNGKLNAVEKKVEKLDADDKKLVQECNKLRDDLRVLNEKFLSLPKAAQRQKKAPTTKNKTTNDGKSVSRRQTLRSAAEQVKEVSTAKARPRPAASDPIPHASSDDTDDLEAPPKLRTRNGAKRKLAHSDPVNVQTIDLPRQGTSNLKDYLAMAEKYWAGLLPRPTSAEAETDFSKRFLSGLSYEDHRNAIVRLLQDDDLRNITTSSGGETVFTLRWVDLKEAINRSKLLESTNIMRPRAVSKEVEPRPGVAHNGEKVMEATKEQSKRPKKKRRIYVGDESDDETV